MLVFLILILICDHFTLRSTITVTLSNMLMTANWQKHFLAIFSIVSLISKVFICFAKAKGIHVLYSCDKLCGCLCQSCSAYIFHFLFVRIKCWQSNIYVSNESIDDFIHFAWSTYMHILVNVCCGEALGTCMHIIHLYWNIL